MQQQNNEKQKTQRMKNIQTLQTCIIELTSNINFISLFFMFGEVAG